MMREALDHLPFIIAAYSVGIGSTVLLVWWSWLDMRRAERRREETREK